MHSKKGLKHLEAILIPLRTLTQNYFKIETLSNDIDRK